ncbi:beta-galactosidase [Thermogemmatispora sp.]|uniref:beta-galactosidase n=1 Tax=Thermogemmatispora sp. TaxID=1968838 RepID=UPI00263657A5|nr:beta-galactosidase [Thermogemmatispora sp.]
MTALLRSDRVLVFADPAYPRACSQALLGRLLPTPFEVCDAIHLAEALEGAPRLLVSFHGPYFPKAAWNALLHFLERGGNLAIFGGMPFARPVTATGEVEPEQDVYTRQLCLGPFFPVDLAVDGGRQGALRLVAAPEAHFLQNCALPFSDKRPGHFWACYPRLTQTSDYPEEIGSAGPFDTLLRPLLFLVAATPYGDERLATPAFVLDQLGGRFRGGRWLLSLWEPAAEEDWLALAEPIQRLIAFALEDPLCLATRPVLACYQPQETPALVVTLPERLALELRISVTHVDDGELLQSWTFEEPASPLRYERYLQLPSSPRPGLYRVRAEYRPGKGQWLAQETGFWVWDEALIAATRGKRLVAGRDYFYQGERLFLVCGTTYMDSRVQRKYWRLPNPARWEREMAEMKAAGINLLRTGLWTAWREVMPVAGVPTESFLRALDAFILTACRHELQVIFTFFAFFPPLFDGLNPWLDPRSLEAQERFLSLLARRYARVELLSWDLINEPSFGAPARAFAQRPVPNYDRYEQEAFVQWLKERYSLEQLQLRWRETPAELPSWEQVRLPREADYSTAVRDTTARAMLKVADYTRFSQEMFVTWARRMYRAIRAAGSQTLIGVGQDEAGARIAPQFYASAVDYTTTHPWWNVDDLLWDMLLDKTPERPNLIQETGVMLVRDVDGRPWRTEQANAWLLERKLIMGLMANGAGLIQWLWHTNAYMTSENENSIGLVRADGSAKPELLVMREFCRLVQALEGQLQEAPEPPPVWLVIPYSQWFIRPDLGALPTRQAVRALAYELGVIPQLIGEHRLPELLSRPYQPQVLIVPSLQFCEPAAWFAVLDYVYRGGTALVSGVIGRDLHNLPFDARLNAGQALPEPEPVAPCEELWLDDGSRYWLSFAQEKTGYVRKAHNELRELRCGAGRLLWTGLPLELASELEPLARLYQRVLERTPLEPQPEGWRRPWLLVRRPLKEGRLLLVASEAGSEQSLVLQEEGLTVVVAPQRAGAVLWRLGERPRLFGGLRLLETD